MAIRMKKGGGADDYIRGLIFNDNVWNVHDSTACLYR